MQNGYSGGVVISLTVLALILGVVLGMIIDGNEDLKETTSSVMGGESDTNNLQMSEEESDQPAFTIVVSNLPEAQQSALRSMGIDANEITVTKGMLGCAEAKIGSQRMNEIRGGASPSAGESISLLACYSQN